MSPFPVFTEEIMNNDYIHFSHIRKEFPGVVALSDIDFSVRQGEVHAILGENGAGKSTLLNILHGVYKATSGNVYIDGKEADFHSTYDAITHGVVKIHQEIQIVENLNVGQNIALGFEKTRKGFLDYKDIYATCDHILEELGCSVRSRDPVAGLGVGDLQMVQIAKCLYFDANIISFDEPTSALSYPEIEKLFEIIRNLKAKGITILFISHKLDELYQICDRVTVLRDGKCIATENMADISKSDLIHMMVGRDVSSYAKRTRPSRADYSSTVLEVKHLCGRTFEDVSFKLHRGEILGFAGLVGAQRTEVMRAVFGADPVLSGEILLNGKKISPHSPEEAMQDGICLISEDRKREGFIPSMDNNRNVNIPGLRKYCRKPLGRLDERGMLENFRKYADLVQLNIRNPEHKTINLSGGNQQKVIIAKWLAADAEVLIFDEPTKGVDVGAKSEIYELMEEFVEGGRSIIMVSSELTEAIGMSDNIVVMREGHVTGVLSKNEFSEVKILSYAMEEQNENS